MQQAGDTSKCAPPIIQHDGLRAKEMGRIVECVAPQFCGRQVEKPAGATLTAAVERFKPAGPQAAKGLTQPLNAFGAQVKHCGQYGFHRCDKCTHMALLFVTIPENIFPMMDFQ